MRDTTAAAPPLAGSRAFPATPAQVREARRFLAAALDGRAAADDAVVCLSELAANATIHSRSRRPGGHFTVRTELRGDHLRVEVHDEGGPWSRLPPRQRAARPRVADCQPARQHLGPQRRQRHRVDRLVRDALPPGRADQISMEHS